MIRKILVAVDFSECATVALAKAIELSRDTHAELILVSAVELPLAPANEVAFIPSYVYEDYIERVKARFAQLLEDVQRAAPSARGHIEIGSASEVIQAAIRREQPALVVLGTHGRRGLSHLYLGSIAERVMRTSTVPVLAVRHGADRVETQP